ncbi:MAG: hypothetical protein JNM52_01920 [Betaproteobacteria bacterium]|nr:hypothetical protein [Betaproteobacteria bacterium]
MKALTLAATLSFSAALSNTASELGTLSMPAYLPSIAAVTPYPAMTSVLFVLLLITFGLYALSAADLIGPLPLKHPIIYGITALYLIRGLFLVPQALGYNIFTNGQTVSGQDLVFSAAVLAIGLVHLIGLRSWESK